MNTKRLAVTMTALICSAVLATPAWAYPARGNYSGPGNCPGAITEEGKYKDEVYWHGDGMTYRWAVYAICDYPAPDNNSTTVSDGWHKMCQSTSNEQPSGCGSYSLYGTCWTYSNGTWECDDGSGGISNETAADDSIPAGYVVHRLPPGSLVGGADITGAQEDRDPVEAAEGLICFVSRTPVLLATSLVPADLAVDTVLEVCPNIVLDKDEGTGEDDRGALDVGAHDRDGFFDVDTEVFNTPMDVEDGATSYESDSEANALGDGAMVSTGGDSWDGTLEAQTFAENGDEERASTAFSDTNADADDGAFEADFGFVNNDGQAESAGASADADTNLGLTCDRNTLTESEVDTCGEGTGSACSLESVSIP